MTGASDAVIDVVVADDGATIIACGVDGHVRSYDARMGKFYVCFVFFCMTHIQMRTRTNTQTNAHAHTNARVYFLLGRVTDDFVSLAGVTSVSVSDDDACLLATSLDDTARLFDRSDGALLATYTGAHTTADYRCEAVFTAGDAHVVVGSANGNISVYDLVSGDCVHTLE
jgi:WD40 repeat protein